MCVCMYVEGGGTGLRKKVELFIYMEAESRIFETCVRSKLGEYFSRSQISS